MAEGELFVCPHCGMSVDVANINMKTRRGSCDWCGHEIIFPKKHVAGGVDMVTALEEGYRLFAEGNFESAKSTGERVIAQSRNNVTALYLVSYHKAFSAEVKSSKVYENIFTQVLPEAEFEIEDEDIFKKLLIKTVRHSMEYDTYILKKFLEYDDPKELGDFVEQFCPVALTLRQNLEFFTPEVAEVYKEITRRWPIPKTWYALYTLLTKNPDSPIVSKQFYLKTKSQRIYDNVVLPIGEIFAEIKDPALQAKFVGGYQKVKAAFEAGLKNG